MGHSLVIRNAEVVDLKSGHIHKRTLYIADGKFTGPIPEGEVPVLDAEGCCAAPGFVDSHVHIFEGHGAISIPADKVGVEQGVLTVVDAGSTGIRDFPFFEKEIIRGNRTDVRFFLNIAPAGLCDGLSELKDMDSLMTAEELASFQREHGERMVGLKVRMSGSVVKESGLRPLAYARELSDKSGLPLMIHIGNAPPPLDQVLDLLRSGDIVTHCFHGKTGGVPYYPEQFKAAAQRGVRFDVGHGAASFSYETVPKVLDIHPVDFSISTDLYDKNYGGPVGSLMETMTKFLPMGYPVKDLVRRVTALPREMLGLPPAGVEDGDVANLTLFRMVQEERELIDSEGYPITVGRSFRPVASIIAGERVWSDEFCV